MDFFEVRDRNGTKSENAPHSLSDRFLAKIGKTGESRN